MLKTTTNHRERLAGTVLTCWRVDALRATPGRPMHLISPSQVHNRRGHTFNSKPRSPLYLSDLMSQPAQVQMACFFSAHHQQPVADCYCGIHATKTHEVLVNFGETVGQPMWEVFGDQVAVSKVRLHGPLFEQDLRDPAGTVVGSAAEYQQIYIPQRYLGSLPQVPQRVSVKPLETLSDQWARKLDEVQKLSKA